MVLAAAAERAQVGEDGAAASCWRLPFHKRELTGLGDRSKGHRLPLAGGRSHAAEVSIMHQKPILTVGLAAALLCAMPAAFAADRASETFIKEAIEGNLAEVQVGKLAQDKGQSDGVKSFGQMLVTDHGAANQKATQVASQMGVTPPAEPNAKQKKVYDKLAKLSGDKFDRAFAKAMVKDHKQDIKEFEKATKKTQDPAKSFASETLPTLRKHLETAQSLAKK
jgi:putative membrane protein